MAEQQPSLPMPPESTPWMEVYPKMHFLYGSLMNPAVLSQVLGLTQTPELKPAHIQGYRNMRWGPYSILKTKPLHVLNGVGYMAQNLEDTRKLFEYEPKHFQEREGKPVRYDLAKFKTRRCPIQLEDGTEIRGIMLVWCGNEAELEDPSRE